MSMLTTFCAKNGSSSGQVLGTPGGHFYGPGVLTGNFGGRHLEAPGGETSKMCG